ncbi:ATP-binding protein [Acidobacteriota bacterium]
MKRKQESSGANSITRIAVRAMGLMLVIPVLVIFYLFREHLEGKELALFFLFATSILGFSLLWTVLRAIRTFHKSLVNFARGDSQSLALTDGPVQLREMSEIINALNKLTIDLQDNTKQLEKFIQQFATLAEFTEITAKMPNIDELLDLVLKKSMFATHSARGTILLRREEKNLLDIIAYSGWNPAKIKGIGIDETYAGTVIQSGKPMLVENIEKAEGIARPNHTDIYESPSFLIMPLKTKTMTLGAVCLSRKITGGEFNSHDQQFLTVLLGQIGFAVENARLLRQARESAKKLKITVEDQETQIQTARQQVRQAEKLSALGQLAGGIAHDFNNIVQAIFGYTEFAKEGLSKDDDRFSHLEQIKLAAERASGLTSQLLAFGRRQLLQPIDLNLNMVIDDVVSMLKRVIGEHIELDLVLDEDLARTHADLRQVEQVLMNLCINSRDAMPEGGKITINTSNILIDVSNREHFCWAEPGDYVMLSVVDTGCGMDKEVLDQVFEPFFTTKEIGQGTGLGLATVYGIIRQHGGVIGVTSEVGKGTEFRICFPSAERCIDTLDEEEEDAPVSGTETVLLAEDEETVRQLCARILNKAGYTVLAAADGEEAVKFFIDNADRISVVLLDVYMPKMSGYEACKIIRSINPDVKVLFCSAYSPDHGDSQFLRDEGLQLIQKPFKHTDLLRKMREILDAEEPLPPEEAYQAAH